MLLSLIIDNAPSLSIIVELDKKKLKSNKRERVGYFIYPFLKTTQHYKSILKEYFLNLRRRVWNK